MRRIVIVVAIGLGVGCAGTASARFSETAKLKPSGLGRLHVGMTEPEVERVLGRDIHLNTSVGGGGCGTARIDGRNFMLFTNGHLRRVDLYSRQYATRKGVRVGTDQGEIRRRYDSAKRSPHAYNPDGFYFKVTYGKRRLVFETDGSEVTAIHGGRIPEVDFVEGCA